MAEDAHDDLKPVENVLPDPAENPRNKLFAQIAASEADGKEGMVDVADEDHDKTVPVVDEPAPAAAPTPATEPSAKRKIKVNGVEQELTTDEIDRLAEKAAGADEQFREAARLRKEAEELRKPPPVQEAAARVDDDDLALARAIQTGSEEEAAAVIKRLKTRPSEPADVQRLIDQRLDFRNSAEWFQKEYPDIVSDPNLLSLVLAEDEKLVNAGDKRPYRARYEQIGTGLRKWRDGLKPAASNTDRIERKAHLQVVPAASVRAAAPREDDDGPSDKEVIAAMGKSRGQVYVTK